MKVLKYILIGIVALIAIFLLIGAFAPKEIKVSRSVVIKGDKAVILDQIKNLRKADVWSPWNEYDPNMKHTYAGTDGEVGSSTSWEGNKDVGTGTQTISSFTDNQVVMDVQFKEPMESSAIATFDLADDADGVKVTWSFVSNMKFPMNAMCVFMDMDAMVGKDFDKGLAKLKDIVEKGGDVSGSKHYDVHEMSWGARTYVGKREEVTFENLGKYFEKQFPALGAALGKAKIAPSGAPSGLYYSWNEKEMKADVAASMQVSDAKAKIAGFETIQIPASEKVLHIAYYGSYDKSMDAHMAMDAYMKEKGLTQNGPVIEEYVTDPMTEKDSAKWLTNIYYIVK